MRTMGNRGPVTLAVLAILLGACSTTGEGASGGPAASVTGSGGAVANDSYPEQPIEFIIPYDAGGGSDVTARLLARLIEPELDVTITPVNKPGGSGAVGLAELHEKPADGYTMMIITSSLSALKPLGTSPYGSEDFDVVATVQAEAYGLAVNADSDIETLEDLLAASEAESLNVGTTAVGGNNFLAAALVNQRTEAGFNLVPYEGGAAPAVTDLAGGVLDASFASPTEFRAQIEADNVRILAITAEERLDAMPDVPTFKELGYDITFETVRVILVPKGTPAERIAVLEVAFEKAASAPRFVEFMHDSGSAARFLTSEETREFVRQQDATYLQLLKDAGLVEE